MAELSRPTMGLLLYDSHCVMHIAYIFIYLYFRTSSCLIAIKTSLRPLQIINIFLMQLRIGNYTIGVKIVDMPLRTGLVYHAGRYRNQWIYLP